MLDLQPPFRRAARADAQALAELVNIAGEGLPFYLWQQMADADQSPWEIGRERARRESAAFSYRNAIIREADNAIVSCLTGYPLADDPPSSDYSGLPAMFVPLQQLEDMASGTWYINALAAYPDHRGKGYGRELLHLAESQALELKKRGMSLIVADSNASARRLYQRAGYHERASRPMVKEAWQHPGSSWVLLVKEL
jgi:ribosomal protein S18 acetylase RimI-like enzyme